MTIIVLITKVQPVNMVYSKYRTVYNRGTRGEQQVNLPSLALTLINSQPVSSATSVGAVKGNARRTPFSVPIQRALWAGVMVEI